MEIIRPRWSIDNIQAISSPGREQGVVVAIGPLGRHEPRPFNASPGRCPGLGELSPFGAPCPHAVIHCTPITYHRLKDLPHPCAAASLLRPALGRHADGQVVATFTVFRALTAIVLAIDADAVKLVAIAL
jgi:hypothetical protein